MANSSSRPTSRSRENRCRARSPSSGAATNTPLPCRIRTTPRVSRERSASRTEARLTPSSSHSSRSPGSRSPGASPLPATNRSICSATRRNSGSFEPIQRQPTAGELATAELATAEAAPAEADPGRPASPPGALGLGRRDLGELLAGSDVVTLHVPLAAGTRGLIGQAELRRMRPGAILVNASRGGVVDEAALAAALEDGHLGGAVVDVYAQDRPRRSRRCSRCPRPRRTGCCTRRTSLEWPTRRPAASTPRRGRTSSGSWSRGCPRPTRSAQPDSAPVQF